MISIVGEQNVEGQDDRIEVITEGKYMMKNGHFLINYKEYDEDLPDKFFNNLVKVENETVTISRKGPLSSQLILEKGKKTSVYVPNHCGHAFNRCVYKNSEQQS